MMVTMMTVNPHLKLMSMTMMDKEIHPKDIIPAHFAPYLGDSWNAVVLLLA